MGNILTHSVGYIIFEYKDGSKRRVRTTLNEKLLIDIGVTQKEGFVYDLDKEVYVSLELPVSFEIYEESVEMDIVNEFASRFI